MMRHPHPLIALAPIALLVALLVGCMILFDGDVLSGPSQIALLVSTAVAALVGLAHGVEWADMEGRIVDNIRSVAVALLILLMIGMMSGTWMASGVVPSIIYYGVKIISPTFFLLTACVLCAIVSVLTGSSWTTVATIGVALMGIGRVEGIADGWTAGAIISGAYFGDKLSPLSDTTVLAASVSGVPLFDHIRYMMLTTVPTMLIALATFGVVGLTSSPTSAIDLKDVQTAIESVYCISPWLLAVPVLTGLLIWRRLPSLVTLFASGLMAMAVALMTQGDMLRQVGDGMALRGALMAAFGSVSPTTGSEMLDSLVATGGMGGMLPTIWLIICAMCFGGTMEASHCLASLVTIIKRLATTTFGLVASNIFTGLLLNIATTDQYMSIVLNSNLFRGLYGATGHEKRLLSRTTEDSTTVTSVLIPWNTCGLTQSTVLGVATMTYMPFCIFNWLSPIMSLVMAATGWRVKRPEAEKDLSL